MGVEGDSGPEPFRVRPVAQARGESEKLFKPKERVWVLRQLRFLAYWPLDAKAQGELGTDLDFSTVTHDGEKFYELRLDDAALSRSNLRVFFWVHDDTRTVWIMHGYWKKTNKIDTTVKTRVCRRIKCLKGALQDGSII